MNRVVASLSRLLASLRCRAHGGHHWTRRALYVLLDADQQISVERCAGCPVRRVLALPWGGAS